ncbi:unnamed protein product [Coffea canephora]|uniref:Cysteine proteinase inhibitor CPI-4 n=1 Tax=Coffea canephora TaxID=49390 RepID=G4Y628_COFCA|nr:cysteine proteinase inhibitor CPI-4 [Coffea canephora]CDP11222.1 unnamed protein product [Coffea canephora]
MATVAAKSATAAIGAGQKNMVGGGLSSTVPPRSSTVNPKDPHVIQIAQFAVANYNAKAGTTVVWLNVEYGFWWIDDDTYYMLAIKTQDLTGTHCDVALVREISESNGTYSLKWYNHNNK